MYPEMAPGTGPGDGYLTREAFRQPARYKVSRHGMVVLNISETGMLIESSAGFRLGETIQVLLPQAGEVAAEVVRVEGAEYGCRFFAPVSAATVSAVMLASRYEPTPLPSEVRRDARDLLAELEPALQARARPSIRARRRAAETGEMATVWFVAGLMAAVGAILVLLVAGV